MAVNLESTQMKVFFTGGAGFIGSHVVPKLLKNGHSVKVFDNMSHRGNFAVIEKLQRDFPEQFQFVEGDVRDSLKVYEEMNGCTHVIHFATVSINKSLADPLESGKINFIGNGNVFYAASKLNVKRIVFASSASVYGDPKKLPMQEEDELNPLTPYCISKRAGEDLLKHYERISGLEWIALRFFNVYGEGQKTSAYYTSVINNFVNRIKKGEVPLIEGSGEQSMDFVHVDDVAEAVCLSLESKVACLPINIGTGISTTIAQLASMLLEAVGSDSSPIFSDRKVLVSKRQADIGRAFEVLSWKPATTVVIGMKELINGKT